MEYHAHTIRASLEKMETEAEGLPSHAAAERKEFYGTNELKKKPRRPLVLRIIDQLKNPMVLVLIGAAVLSGVFSEAADMLIILAVVAINTTLGVVQEAGAENAIDALSSMTPSLVKVRRNGGRIMLDAAELVPGDIVELEAGDFVPADMRLIESASLKAAEAALTGEAVPSEKDADGICDIAAPLGDRINMCYSGTSVSYGRGVGVVTATGMDTEVGRIADSLNEAIERETPIQRRLAELSKILTFIVLGVCAVVFAVSAIRSGFGGGVASAHGEVSGSTLLDSFLLAVSLAVAAIPEGLAAVVTIVMAMGVQRMAKNGAIIRKLPAVETLGCAQVICSDKTGTLTQNRMTVVRTFVGGRMADAEQTGGADAQRLIEALALCNDADPSGETGDPTETALIHFARRAGVDVGERIAAMPRAGELPFDSERKLMTTFHSAGGKVIQYTKGAPDILLERCDRILISGTIEPLSPAVRAVLKEANERMAQSALRVLSAAMNLYDTLPGDGARSPESVEQGLVFIGHVGMIDPARPEVGAAVETAIRAGMRPVMITGDHKVTASAIARELGILDGAHRVITGAELDAISDEELEREIELYAVFARVAPEHKVRIVAAWQKRGRVVAMTGDGVNDAPALKTADIGVGMGITGTEVTKSVADMVLSDDNFATIILAVEEGRKIYTNIRKCIQFLLSCNLSEVLAVLVATLAGVRILHTIHILWINLVTDSLPALALGMEKAEPDIMRRSPRTPDEGIFAGHMAVKIAYQGAFIAATTLVAAFIGERHSHETAMTMAFCTLVFSQMFHSLNVRSLTGSLLSVGVFGNRLLWGALLGSVLLTVLLVVVPPLASLFRLVPLTIAEWGICTALSVSVLPLVELVKRIFYAK